MTDCYLCHKPMLDEHDLVDDAVHKVCDTEFDNRIRAGMCERCGIRGQSEVTRVCYTCDENKSGYSGYEGSQ